MVRSIKPHFFVRYRAFESWAHLTQLAEQGVRAEADQRRHGTVQAIVAERFAREAAAVRLLPATRYDTASRAIRQVRWAAAREVRGRRYSVPADFAGQTVRIRLTRANELAISPDEQLVAPHCVGSGAPGWGTGPSHHAALWTQTLAVEQRPVAEYEEGGA